MSLVFTGVCSHGPGITARRDLATPEQRDTFYAAMGTMRAALRAARPDAVMIVAAEHFANFFMDKMPPFAVGMGESYPGPIEDPDWLAIPRRETRGAPDLGRRLITEMLETVDVTYCEEWQFDHGIIVPLHLLDPDNELTVIPANINCQGPPLTPLHRAWAFGEALRRAADAVPERIALIATGGLSHWPATPDSGKINFAWDTDFMERWLANDRNRLLAYTNAETYRDGGQGGFEIRTYIAAAAAARGQGTLHCLLPIPVYATSGIVATMEIA